MIEVEDFVVVELHGAAPAQAFCAADGHDHHQGHIVAAAGHQAAMSLHPQKRHASWEEAATGVGKLRLLGFCGIFGLNCYNYLGLAIFACDLLAAFSDMDWGSVVR